MRQYIYMLAALLGTFLSSEVSAVAYAINSGNNTVFVINEVTGQVTYTIPTEGSPKAMAISPDQKTLYIAITDNNTVEVKDAETGDALATISGFSTPIALAIEPTSGSFLAVANQTGYSVSFVDTQTNTITSTAFLDDGPGSTSPSGIAVAPDGKTVYTSNSNTNDVSSIDVSDLQTPILSPFTRAAGTSPSDIIISPDGQLLFVSNEGSNNMTVISLFSGTVATVEVGSAPTSLAWHPEDHAVYVANSANATLSVVDIPNTPVGIVFTPDNNYAYVVNRGSNNVSVFDTSDHTAVASIAVGGTPTDIAITSDGQYVYVCNSGADSVSIIDTSSNTVANTVSVGSQPVSIAISTNYAYTANQGSNNISLIDLSSRTFKENIAVSGSPKDIASGTQAINQTIDYVCVVSSTDSGYGVATFLVDDVIFGTSHTANNPIRVVTEPVTANSSGTRVAVVCPAGGADAGQTSIITTDLDQKQFSMYNVSTNDNPADAVFWISTASTNYDPLVYITNKGSANVSIYDASDSIDPGGSFNTQAAPLGIVLASGSTTDDDRIYVSNSGPYTDAVGGDSVTVFNPNVGNVGGGVVQNVTVGYSPIAITVSPNVQVAYVANAGDHTISVLTGLPDITHVTEVMGAFAQSPTELPSNPSHVAITPDGCVALAYHSTNTISYGLPQHPCSSTVYGFNQPNAIIFSTNPDHLLNTSASLHTIKSAWCTELYAKLEWGAMDNIAQYQILMNGEQIATLSSDQTTYEAHGLPPNQELVFILRVITNSGVVEDFRFEPLVG